MRLVGAALPQNAGSAFITQQAQGQWRSSRLIGVSILGPDQKTIGKIDEVILGHDGSVKVVVIGVGGFLGMGKKDVGVPFAALHWKTEPRQFVIDAPSLPAKPSAEGMVGQSLVVKSDPAATEASQGYPDVGLLDMTKEQLMAAPDFHYAPRPDLARYNATDSTPKN